MLDQLPNAEAGPIRRRAQGLMRRAACVLGAGHVAQDSDAVGWSSDDLSCHRGSAPPREAINVFYQLEAGEHSHRLRQRQDAIPVDRADYLQRAAYPELKF